MDKHIGEKKTAVMAGDGTGREVMPEGIRIAGGCCAQVRSWPAVRAFRFFRLGRIAKRGLSGMKIGIRPGIRQKKARIPLHGFENLRRIDSLEVQGFNARKANQAHRSCSHRPCRVPGENVLKPARLIDQIMRCFL
jgi:hypothetical protein